MPRNNTTPHAVPGRASRKSTGRRKTPAGKTGSRVAAMPQQQPQQLPPQPEQQPEQEQQTASPSWQEPEADDYELDGKAEWDDVVQSAQDASKTRQRIEMLREERLLQQALIDTFDL
jgi:hypothetical protein